MKTIVMIDPLRILDLSAVPAIQYIPVNELIDYIPLMGKIKHDLIIINSDNIGTDVGSTVDTIRTVEQCVHLPFASRIAITHSHNTDDNDIKKYLNHDVDGIFPIGEDYTIDEQLEAIDQLVHGVNYIPAEIKKRIFKCEDKPTNLTKRQYQILTLIRQRGISNKTIARMLNISESTVKLHITQILKKCGVKNRTQLALFNL